MKRVILGVVGAGLLVLGIALVLCWWPQVIQMVKGLIGIFLALVGMVILTLARGDED